MARTLTIGNRPAVRIGSPSVGRAAVALAGGGGVELLRVLFNSDQGAPLALAPFTIADTDERLSTANGELVIAADTADATMQSPAFDHAAGMALYIKARRALGTVQVGFGTSNALVAGLSGTALHTLAGVAVAAGGLDSELDDFYIVRSASGFNYYLQGDTLLWVDNEADANTDALGAFIGATDASAAGGVDAIILNPLTEAAWLTDYALATSRLAGSRAQNDAYTIESDCIISWIVTTIASSASGPNVRFRWVDSTNYWELRPSNTGTIVLFRILAGASTNQGSATSAISNGDRVTIRCIGNTIEVWVNETLRINKTDATDHASATGGLVGGLGTGGVVSDIVAWPRTIGGTAYAALTALSAPANPAPLSTLTLDWITDVHLDVAVTTRQDEFEDFVTAANVDAPDYTVLTGDLVDDNDDATTLMTTAKGILDTLTSDYRVILGNHDLIPNDADKAIGNGPTWRSNHLSIFGYDDFNYATDVGDARLIFVDTNYDSSDDYGWVVKADTTATVLAWLENELETTSQRYAIVCTHQPVSDISQWTDYPAHEPDQGVQDAFQAIFDASPVPVIILCGHEHPDRLLRPETPVPISSPTQTIGRFGKTPVYLAPNFFRTTAPAYSWQRVTIRLYSGGIVRPSFEELYA